MTSTLLHSMLRIAGNGSNMSMGGLMRATQSVSMRSLTTTCMSIDAAKALSVSAAATASRKSDSKIILKNSLQKRDFVSSSEVATTTPVFPPGALATSEALKSPTAAITYDNSNHDRIPPGDPSRRAFTYFVLTGGRFIYASAIRLAVLKFVLSMSASKDVLALASLEVDLGSIPEGNTVTVKWRGKPVFIRHRTQDEIDMAGSVSVDSLRDPQEDSVRVVEPNWLIVIGVCTHLGCVPLANAGDYNGWFCPCHGSHYDVSGRIRKGPAPYNLEVPEYKFLDDSKLLIG